MRRHVPLAVAALLFGAASLSSAGEVLWDNNNVTPPCICSMSSWAALDRSLLDDFEVDGDGWLVTRFSSIHHWNSLPPGSGESYNLWLRENVLDPGFGQPEGPGDVLMSLKTTGYEEIGTGEECFARPNFAAGADVEPVFLPPGTYWVELQIAGPENNFGLCADPPQRLNECWVDYADIDGLRPSTWQFGDSRWVSFRLYGERVECAADIDHSGAVDFGDVLALIAAWGVCPHHSGCVEDLDGDGVVGVLDLLAVLAGWGPCF